ncbi:hypothetical protein GCM10023190_05710 [Enteractinococcus fodinae]
MTGNLLETGRSFYEKYRDESADAAISATAMAELHRMSMTPSLIADTGYDLGVSC